jgi:hypothetical protein
MQKANTSNLTQSAARRYAIHSVWRRIGGGYNIITNGFKQWNWLAGEGLIKKNLNRPTQRKERILDTARKKPRYLRLAGVAGSRHSHISHPGIFKHFANLDPVKFCRRNTLMHFCIVCINAFILQAFRENSPNGN